jgi:hypothetical protein
MASEVVVSASMCFLDCSTKSGDCTPMHADIDAVLLDLSTDESVLSSTHTVVASEEFRDTSLLGLNGVPVSGQGRCGIGVIFAMEEDGAMVLSLAPCLPVVAHVRVREAEARVQEMEEEALCPSRLGSSLGLL